MVNKWVLIGVVIGVTVLGLSIAPLPGYCNVQIQTQMTEVQAVFASYYQVNGVNGIVTGHATVLDWGGILGLTWPSLTANFQLKSCLSNGQCASADETKLFPTLPWNTQLSAQGNINLAYVPAGTYTIQSTLTVNGNNQGSATNTLTVSC